MKCQPLLLGLSATLLLLLLLAPKAPAWGGLHVGYTHVGPAGVDHYGHTAAVGPYGAYGRYGGAYHAGVHYGAPSGAYYAGESNYGANPYAYAATNPYARYSSFPN